MWVIKYGYLTLHYLLEFVPQITNYMHTKNATPYTSKMCDVVMNIYIICAVYIRSVVINRVNIVIVSHSLHH